MKISKSTFYGAIYAAIILILSVYVLPFYIWGDQIFYRMFYEDCFIWNEGQKDCYTSTLGTSEPGYFYLVKFFHTFLDKDYFVAIANATIAFLLVKLIFKYYRKVWHRHIFIILVLLNYYILILFFSAERLKFAALLILIATLIQGRSKILFILASLFTHIQIVFLAIPLFIPKFINKNLSILKKIAYSVATTALFIGVLFGLKSHIMMKISAYSGGDSSTTMGVLKTLFFVALTIFNVRNIYPLLSGIPLLIAAYIFGGDRISIFAFILYLAYSIYYKAKMDVIMFIILIYFAYTGLDIIQNIINYGSAYLSQV